MRHHDLLLDQASLVEPISVAVLDPSGAILMDSLAVILINLLPFIN